MNERYTSEERRGTTRKSAASAKPKAKAASSVTVQPAKKTPEQKKAQQKAARKEAAAKQRELERKYYKPDTKRYKVLRRLWWVLLIGAIACTVLSFFAQQIIPLEASVVVLVLAYVFIIGAFVIDLWPIRKERAAYQQRMMVEEAKREKAEKAAQRAQQSKMAAAKKGSGKNQNRHAAPKAGGEGEAAGSDEAPADEKPAKKRGLFGGGFGLSKRDKAQAEQETQQAEKAE